MMVWVNDFLQIFFLYLMDFQSPIVSKKNFEKSSNMKKYKGNIAIYPTKIYLAIKIQLLGKIKLPTYRWGDPEIVKI